MYTYKKLITFIDPKNMLGSGSEAYVFSIPENPTHVLRVARHLLKFCKIELEDYYKHQPLNLLSQKDDFPSKNYGQALWVGHFQYDWRVALSINKRINGYSLGNIGRNSRSLLNQLKYLNILKTLNSLPHKHYINLINDIKLLRDKNYILDVSENNIIYNPQTKTLHPIDYKKKYHYPDLETNPEDELKYILTLASFSYFLKHMKRKAEASIYIRNIYKKVDDVLKDNPFNEIFPIKNYYREKTINLLKMTNNILKSNNNFNNQNEIN